MGLKESEAIILRTYPLREADLLVTLFTRLDGKVHGVARSAKKSKRRFGGALEPLTYVRAYYEDREGQELARLDSCDVLESPLAFEVTYPRAVALGHVAELLDELLPEREANDAVFRLSLAVLAALRGSDVWMPVTYFELWMTRLMGYLPDLSECLVCGRALNGSRAFFHALSDGLMCPETSGWRLLRFRMNRGARWARCFVRRLRVLPAGVLTKSYGQGLAARICGSFWCRPCSGILRRNS